ncbi:MAG: ATP-binding cassette domain-containing protein, partial [candidate division WOR-3 bacterium]
MITVKGVSRRFDDRVVLDHVSFDIPDRKVIAILGPSGVGKTVLLRIMTGLLSPDRGTVEYDGVPVRFGAFADNSELLSRLGFVFQGGALFDSLSV